MDIFKKIIFFTGSAGMGIYALLMLISALLMAFTPEVSGWMNFVYIFLSLALFASAVFIVFFPDIGEFFHKFVIAFPIIVLLYVTAVVPDALMPLYASLRVWSGISIFGLFGNNAVWISSLVLFECYLLFSLGVYLHWFGKIAFPLTRFICMNVYFMIFLPTVFTTDFLGTTAMMDKFPMYTIIVPVFVLYCLLVLWRKYSPLDDVVGQIVSYIIFIAVTVGAILFTFGFTDIFIWLDGVFSWYGKLVQNSPWTIIFAPIVILFVYGYITGAIEVRAGAPAVPYKESRNVYGRTAAEQQAYNNRHGTHGMQ